MRYLLLILALPFFTANAAAPECEELKKWTKDLELKMQSTRIEKDCEKLSPANLGLAGDAPDFEKYRCKDFSALELQLKSVESEIAILRGIRSLKLEIEKAKENLKLNGDKSLVEANTKTFFRNLKFAADLELFLGANNSKKENILTALAKAKPAELGSVVAFGKLIQEKCKEFNVSQASVCSQQFALTEDFRADFLELVKLGKNSEPKFDKAHVNRLKDALAIKSKTADYSYGQYLKEMKNPEASIITSEDLAKLKSLPEFSNSKKFDFITKLKNSRNNLGRSGPAIEAQGAPARFKSFLEALKNREAWELKSKLFVVLKQFESRMTDATKQTCDNSRSLGPDIDACFKALAETSGLQSFEVNAIKDLKDEFTAGQNQVTKLDDLLGKCIPDQNLNYPTDCDGIVTDRMAELEQKAQLLSALKIKVFEATPEIMIFRNYALEKLLANECLKPDETNIPDCYGDVGPISRQAVALTDTVNNIIYVYGKPAEATQIDQLCKQGKENVPYKDELCKWKVSDASKKTNSILKEQYEAPVSPGKRASTTLSNIGTLATNLFKAFAPANPQAAFNPYPSPSPYTGNYPGLLHPYQNFMQPALSTGMGNFQNLTGTSGEYAFGGSSVFNAPYGRNLI